jgi:poly-gamma-glutamate synthesis protein (capsule biosynthesis protein)
MKKILLIIIPLLFLSCPPIKADTAIISFTGDIIMHIPVKRCVINHNITDTATKKSINNQGFDYLFQEIKHNLLSDITIGNMEFPVSPPFESKPWIFNCTPDVISAMKKAGFTMMHIGNNHILDQGGTGVANTINYIKKNNLSYIGAGLNEADTRSGVVIEKNGIKIGIIGYTGILNYQLPKIQKGFYVNWLYDKNKVLEDIASIKKRCDYIIMVAHYGTEYDLLPSDNDRKILAEYITAGVNLVVGHHPHLLQPAEKIKTPDNRENFIFHSLGNFISNQSGTSKISGDEILSTRDSIILKLKLEKTRNGFIQKLDIIPIMTRNEYNPVDKKQEIQTVTISSVIEKIKNRKADKTDPMKQKEIDALNKRINIIEKTLLKNNIYDNITIVK